MKSIHWNDIRKTTNMWLRDRGNTDYLDLSRLSKTGKILDDMGIVQHFSQEWITINFNPPFPEMWDCDVNRSPWRHRGLHKEHNGPQEVLTILLCYHVPTPPAVPSWCSSVLTLTQGLQCTSFNILPRIFLSAKRYWDLRILYPVFVPDWFSVFS